MLSAWTIALPALAQTAGDYRSAASGNWNDVATWETYDGANWNAATSAPNGTNVGAVTIISPHNVAIVTSINMDQVVVSNGATLAVTNHLNVFDGPDIDLAIYGTVIALGNGLCLTIGTNASVVVKSGGVLIHNGTANDCIKNNGGTVQFASGGKFTMIRGGSRIPISTWDPDSICEVAYLADNSKPDTEYLGQEFGNFVVNCPLNYTGWDLRNLLTNIRGDLIVTMGPEYVYTEFKLNNTGGYGTAFFGGDIIINSGRFNWASGGGPYEWTLRGNLVINPGASMHVSGTVNSIYTLLLDSGGVQNYTCTGTNIAFKLNWTIKDGTTLNLNNDLPLTAMGRTLTADGIVNVNGNVVSADLVGGNGTIRNQGGGSGSLVVGTSDGVNTLDGALKLLDGASGTLGLAKAGSNTLTITAPQTFSGGLVVSNGTVLVNNATGSGTGSGTVTVYGGIMGGNGIISGAVGMEYGTVLSPGSSTGRLTISNTLTLAGDTLIEVDKASGTNDQVVANSVNYGGTLTVADLSGGLGAGDSFTIFRAGSHTGNFTSIIGSPGANLAWDFNPASGVLSVVSAGVNPPTLQFSAAGNTLSFSWEGTDYKLQGQTNSLATGLGTNWSDYPGGDTSPVDITIDVNDGAVFFRLAPQ
jgi:autotransporter-associated beta strand protein